jgi:hypothetical protein
MTRARVMTTPIAPIPPFFALRASPSLLLHPLTRFSQRIFPIAVPLPLESHVSVSLPRTRHFFARS